MADTVPPFEGNPQLKATELRTYTEAWRCPQPGCSGEMQFNGLPSMSPYPHKCSVCGYEASLATDKYPRTYQEPIGTAAPHG